jgi:hypothetical protein
MKTKIYHISFNEKYMPHGINFYENNKIMAQHEVYPSTKFRKGSPQFGSSYMVLFMDGGNACFSRVDRRHYDAFEVFNDGHEMRECSCYEEFEKMIKEFVQKGFIEIEE